VAGMLVLKLLTGRFCGFFCPAGTCSTDYHQIWYVERNGKSPTPCQILRWWSICGDFWPKKLFL